MFSSVSSELPHATATSAPPDSEKAQGGDFQSAVENASGGGPEAGGSAGFDDFNSLLKSKPGLAEIIKDGPGSVMDSDDQQTAYEQLTGVLSHKQIAEMTPAQVATAMGVSQNMPLKDEKAPAGISAAQIKQLNNGLLGACGNQHINSTPGNKGFLESLVEKCGGHGLNSLNNPDVAWRVYTLLTKAKGATESSKNGGSYVPFDELNNGKIDGFGPSHDNNADAYRGTVAANIEDLIKGGPLRDHLQNTDGTYATATGGDTSGAHQVGDKIKHGFETLGNDIKNVFVGIGHGIEHVFEGIGHGIDDFFHGHVGEAFGDVGKGFTDGARDVIHPVTKLVGDTVENFVPVVGDAIGKDIKGVGNGACDALQGTGKAMVDIGKGQFGDAARDWLSGNQKAFKDVSSPLIHTVSNVVSDVPGLENTKFAKDIKVGSDWIADKASGLYNGVTNFCAAPVENAGDTVSYAMRGEWSKAGHSALETLKTGGELAVAAAPMLLTGGAAAPLVAAAGTAVRTGLTVGLDGARGVMSVADGGGALGRTAQTLYDAGGRGFQASKGTLYKGYQGVRTYTNYNHASSNTDYANGRNATNSRLDYLSPRSIYARLAAMNRTV